VIEDFQSARLRLSECLEGLSGEIIRQKEDSARAVGEIKTALEQSQQRLVPRQRLARGQQGVDPVTGLPGRSEAEASVLEASQKDGSAFAALFVIDRVELINMRYGYAVGDQVLLAFSQHVARHLSAHDRLFRWSGPALLALLEYRNSQRVVREEIERVTSRRLEKTITLVDRTVLLPIRADWVTYPVSGHPSVHALFHQLDVLVQSKSVDRPPDEGAEA